MTENMKHRQGATSQNRTIGIAAVVLVLVLVGAAVWWFAIRDDDSSDTTAESTSNGQTTDDGVPIVQDPSLAASGTVDGASADEPVDVTIGEPSELVVTVVNDGNVTMDDITSTVEFNGADGPIDEASDDCEFPELSPEESADCTLEFTPTEDMTDMVARVLGYGPQDQEVELTVAVTFG